MAGLSRSPNRRSLCAVLLPLTFIGLLIFTYKRFPSHTTPSAPTKLPLQYSKESIPFNATDEERSTFMPPRHSFHSLSPDKMDDFVFMTAASSNHFKEEVDNIASIQTLMPQKKIVFFDIGLKPHEIAQVKSWCSVTYRYFNKSVMPKFAADLGTYTWKVYLIEIALREHNAVFWVDSSFRLNGTDLSGAYRVAQNNGGFVMFVKVHHSNFAVTYPQMYRYLGTDPNAQKHTEMFGGGMLLIYRTEKVFRDILWWLWMCARDKNCIGHKWNINCKFAPKDRYTKYANCHRYDQSAINTILSNIWLRDNTMHYSANQTFFVVTRYPTSQFRIKTC